MKPVLDSWPPKKRTRAFLPFVAGILLVSFLIIALATQNFFLAMLLPPILAVGGAWALVGWPTITTKDGRPLIEARYKPYLFFVLMPLFAVILYPIVGIALTQSGLPPKWLAILSIVLSIAGAVTLAYLLVGIPNVFASMRRQYETLPAERRPFLFFPITVVLFLVLYLTLGVGTTKLMGGLSGDPTPLLNIQILVLLPLCLVIAALLAWALVGIPKPTKRPAEYLPKITGRQRPRVFAATVFFGGLLLTLILGAILTFYTPLPPTVVLGLAFLLAFALAFGIAALSWGTPARWRQYEDYQPGINPRYRSFVLVAMSIAAGLIIAVAIGLADIDLFWGLLAGLLTAGVALLFLTGTHRRIAARKGQKTLVPDLPDGMKPLILFPTWFLITLVLFAVLTYALPGLVPVNLLLALLVGLGVTFFVLEQPLLKDLVEDRKRERQKRQEWEARRKAKLAAAEKGETPPEA